MAFQEPYSNPIAPPDHEPATRGGAKLSNDDFRRLMMTPRATQAPSQAATKKVSSSSQQYQEKKRRTSNSSWQAMVKKEDEERQAEWAKLYRDRAKERRVGENPDYSTVEGAPTATSGYKNVPPNVDPSLVAKQRKLDIAESKFLGGDMAHTHMVKGLDYALLQKVRSEMFNRDREEEEIKLLERKREKEKASTSKAEQQHGAKKGEVTFRTRMGKRIYQTIFDHTPPAKNEFFLPGRMAYVFELDDEYAESDIPTTLLRSKADCPSVEVQTTLSTNDIVINKLTQILSYLRQGSHSSKKNKRKEKAKVAAIEPEKRPAVSTESIFEGTGDYSADVSLASSQPPKRTSYFNKPLSTVEQTTADIHKSTSDFVKAVNTKYGSPPASVEDKIAEGWSQAELGIDTTKQSKTARESSSKKGKSKNLGFGGFEVAGHYAECYPGGMEEMDATVNSDDEADYSKMDMGAHKGPVKRWDFDNEDDYSTYQSSREALPKAAFQYGVKMNDGRKTRRQAGANKEKAKLDREWQQISQILHKRKSEKLDAVTKRLKTD